MGVFFFLSLGLTIIGSSPHFYDYGMTTLGFTSVTIDKLLYENVEYVANWSAEGDPGQGFVLAVATSASTASLLQRAGGCFVGARHEANPLAVELSQEKATDDNFVVKSIKTLDFHWFLNGKRVDKAKIDHVYLDNVGDRRSALRLAYNVYFGGDGKLVARPTSERGRVCCMQLPSSSHSSPTPSNPLFPLINTGRYDVTINGGRIYKNVPYFYYRRQRHIFAKEEPTCPEGLENAIFTSANFSSVYRCLVSIGPSGGTLVSAPWEDASNVTVKRRHLQWHLNGTGVGRIPDALWLANEPIYERRRLGSIYYVLNQGRLFADALDRAYFPCCMNLTAAVLTKTNDNGIFDPRFL